MDKQADARLERFQARLESERQLLLAELESWLGQKSEPDYQALLNQLFRLSNDDLLDALALLESTTAQRMRAKLQAIDASLCQFEIGLYGFCADCEQPIETELLQRDPTRQRCHHCHEQHLKSKQKKHRILL